MFPLNTNPRFSLFLVRTFMLSSIGWLSTVWTATKGLHPTTHRHQIETICGMVVAVLMLSHCVAGAFFLKKRKELLDLCLTCAEISVFVYLNRSLFNLNSLPPWSPQTYTFCVVVLFIQIVALGIIIVLHICSLVSEKESKDLTDSDMQPLALILGRFLFTERDSLYFSKRIRIVRALSAAVLIVLLGTFSFLAIVVLPIHEGGLLPVKEYRTDNDLTDNPGLETPKLQIIAIINLANVAAYDVELFKAAVNVTPLWNEESPSKSTCEYESNEPFGNDGGENLNVPGNPILQTITILCPSYFEPGQNMDKTFSSLELSSWTFPDLLVTVDFSILGISGDALFDARFRTVSIVVGLGQDTSDSLSTTSSTPIYPGSYLLAAVSSSLRRVYVKPALASIASVLTPQRTFLVSEVETLVPDPSPLIPRNNNTGTLRIYPQDDMTEWYITSDYREHDVFGGVGASGGFWTAINGVFAALLGPSLLWVIMGKRPVSSFGFFSFTTPTKEKLVESFPLNPNRERDCRDETSNPSNLDDLDLEKFLWQRFRDSISFGPFDDSLAEGKISFQLRRRTMSNDAESGMAEKHSLLPQAA